MSASEEGGPAGPASDLRCAAHAPGRVRHPIELPPSRPDEVVTVAEEHFYCHRCRAHVSEEWATVTCARVSAGGVPLWSPCRLMNSGTKGILLFLGPFPRVSDSLGGLRYSL